MNIKTMTSAQASERHADQFSDQLRTLDLAAVGVILCRTREPYRAIWAIRNYAFSKDGMGFANWTHLFGWETYDRANPMAEPTQDGEKSVVAALAKIGGLGEGAGAGFPNGFYTMMLPHFWLDKSQAARIPMIFMIKEYVRLFSESKRRLILIAPVGTSLPSEIADDAVVLDFETPSYAELRTALDYLLDTAFGTKTPRIDEEGRAGLVAAGMGMSQHEFETAVSRAIVAHRQTLPNVPVQKVIDEVMKVKTEVVKRSEVLEVMPTTGMDQVGGLENLKAWVAARRNCFSEEARNFGIEPPKGVGLFGPPGTGKSLSAKAIASVLHLPLIKFDVSRVFNSLVGQSEERVRAALKMLDGMAPCVVLLDEVDKAFQRNSGGGDSGVSQRVLGAILTHMQESDAPIFWVFSANRVDNLPAELLRRGRLDEIFAVTVPDRAENFDILSIHLRKRGHDPSKIADLNDAAGSAVGYVPAEVEQAVKDALIDAFTNGSAVSGALITAQFANMKPLREAFADDFARMETWAENNARPASKSLEQKQASLPMRTNNRRPVITGERRMDVGV